MRNGGTPSEVTFGTCDGVGFSRESTCCKDHDNIVCPVPDACYDSDKSMLLLIYITDMVLIAQVRFSLHI